ncbi:serine threonine specific protein phosphatase [Cystoisospora suis]|uniref:protein-tyrosine-phosphatase n=1 Tax=Cystoisospora suis TaxID=483139 RepID=A0A2C6KGH4_9APIC|nr:serine threonine specific protein phosphatase [Cystoisospora suis]
MALVHCSSNTERRANAALLVAAAQMLLFKTTADEAYRPFRGTYPRFVPFRDATVGPCSFKLTVLDCLKGLEYAMSLGWFDYKTFNVDEYDYYEKLENGDMNWVIPKKFLAFSCPSSSLNDHDGYTSCTPEHYISAFKRWGIRLVVRLNKKQYDAKKFTDKGINHADLFFLDGTCPSREIIQKFFSLVEACDHPVAVHCKAGLGRTGTLIGCYAIKHYKFPAVEWIGWNRLCRPGSVLGPQQHYLVQMEVSYRVGESSSVSPVQNELLQMGSAESFSRTKEPSLSERMEDLSDCMAKLSLADRRVAECGDLGQGERLLVVKRQQQQQSGSPPTPPAALAPPPSDPSKVNCALNSTPSRKIFPFPLILSQPLSSAPTPFTDLKKTSTLPDIRRHTTIDKIVAMGSSKCAATVGATKAASHGAIPPQ